MLAYLHGWIAIVWPFSAKIMLYVTIESQLNYKIASAWMFLVHSKICLAIFRFWDISLLIGHFVLRMDGVVKVVFL